MSTDGGGARRWPTRSTSATSAARIPTRVRPFHEALPLVL